MRAELRCKEHYQGDRCRLESGHEGDHVGNFVGWSPDGIFTYKPFEIKHRRNRQAVKEERFKISFIEQITKRLRLMALLNEYRKSFEKEPKNALSTAPIHTASQSEHQREEVGLGNVVPDGVPDEVRD